VPGILQNMRNRNHGLGVACTPDKTEQDPHPTPFDALDNHATVMRALKWPNVLAPTGQWLAFGRTRRPRRSCSRIG